MCTASVGLTQAGPSGGINGWFADLLSFIHAPYLQPRKPTSILSKCCWDMMITAELQLVFRGGWTRSCDSLRDHGVVWILYGATCTKAVWFSFGEVLLSIYKKRILLESA